MMTGELWWNRLVNSVRFLDDVKDILMEGKSVIMNFSDNVPWLDIMLDTLEQRLAFMNDTHSLNTEPCDASKTQKQPGEYLFEKFCSESERKNYWPVKHKSYERFLATNDNTTLNHRIICIKEINSGNAAAWIKSITEYLENRDSEERGMFILIIQGFNCNESKLMGCVKYSDYITDYDCLMLCLTMISSVKCSSTQKQYVSEISSNIAHNNVEIAGILATSGLELAKTPLKTAIDILEENNISITNLKERVRTAVWEAQIKLVFPRLEDCRRELVHKYQNKIKNYLSIISTSSEHVDKVSEIEIGQLYFICSQFRIVEKREFDLLKKMRDARNSLAHRDTLTYNQLAELGIF